MAKNTANLTNAAVPSPDYLTGRPTDASPAGAGNGTPSNLELLGDLVETANKLMREASISPNDAFDNTTNGFQIFDAIIANIRATAASETQRGTVERATQPEVDLGTDNSRYVSPLTLKGVTDTLSKKDQGTFSAVTEVSPPLFIVDSSGCTVRTDDQDNVSFKGFVEVTRTGAPVTTPIFILPVANRPSRDVYGNITRKDVATGGETIPFEILSSTGEFIISPATSGTHEYYLDCVTFVL